LKSTIGWPGEIPSRRVLDALFDGGDEVARNRAPEDVVLELEIGAAGERRHLDPAIGEMAVAARLFLVAPVRFRLAGDRLAVGNLRRVKDHLYVVPFLQPRHRDLDVELTGARKVELLGLLVPLEMERGVLLDQLVESVGDLVLVRLGLGLDGEGDGRLRKGDGRKLERMILGCEAVAREGVLELRDGADVARTELGHDDVFLALGEEQSREPLRRAPARVPVRAVGLERSREDAEIRDPARERIGDRLEHLRERCRSVIALDQDVLAVLVLGRDRRPVGRGEERHARVEEAQDADLEVRGNAHHGEDFPFAHLLLEARQEVGRVESAVGEELFHEVVFPLGDHLDQVLVLDLGALPVLFRDRLVLALAVLEEMRLHPDEVDRAVKALLRSHGNLERQNAASELLLEVRDAALERGPLPVHAVDDEEHRFLELLGELPGLFGLDLDSRDRIHDDHDRVGGGDGAAGLRNEDAVSWRVDEIDLCRGGSRARRRG
jgi:hypothetical protein